MHPDPPAWNNLPVTSGTPAISVTQAHGVNGLSESDGGATAFSIREGEKRNCTLGCMRVCLSLVRFFVSLQQDPGGFCRSSMVQEWV